MSFVLTRSYIAYPYTARAVPARFSLRQYGPPMGGAGTYGNCSIRTMYRMLMTNRSVYGLPFVDLSPEFIISSYLTANYSPPRFDSLYLNTLQTERSASVMKMQGVCRRAVWAGAPQVPSAAQYADALNYKTVEAYSVTLALPSDTSLIAKEIICEGLTVSAEGGMHGSFSASGGGDAIMPSATDTSLAYSHGITFDEYDDDWVWPGSGGVGAFGYVTNGVARGRMSYAYFRRYLKPGTACRVMPVALTFPFPGDSAPPAAPPVVTPTGNAMLREQAITAWTALDPNNVTQAQKDSLIAYAAQLAVSGAVATSVNVALASGGASISATAQAPGYPASNAINGDRTGANGWWSSKPNAMPQVVTVDFGNDKTINKVIVYSVQDNFQSPSLPTDTLAATLFQLKTINVSYWNGNAWVPLGAALNNTLAKCVIQFAPVVTRKIAVNCTESGDGYARIVEVEAWTGT